MKDMLFRDCYTDSRLFTSNGRRAVAERGRAHHGGGWRTGIELEVHLHCTETEVEVEVKEARRGPSPSLARILF